MSLDYSFALDTTDQPEDLLRWMESTFSMQGLSDKPYVVVLSSLNCPSEFVPCQPVLPFGKSSCSFMKIA